MMKKNPAGKWIAFAVSLLLLLCAAASGIAGYQIRTALPTMDAAKTWAGESEMRFAQIACFFSNEQLEQEDSVFRWRQSFDKKLMEAAIEAPENGSLFTDAYSGQGRLSVTGKRGNASVRVIGIGGDFFRFHPLQLRSGSYLAETDLMQDRVLLDEELAWQLFGGIDLTGLSVTINGSSYYIAGVVAREKDRYSTVANTEQTTLYMSFSALKQLDQSAGISCYEAVLPNQISSFAKNMVQEVVPTENGVIVENSSRYSIKNLLQVMRDFGKRSMGVNGIIYPYWENAVRLTEDYAALTLVLTVLFSILPVICILTVLYRLLARSWKWTKVTTKTTVSDRIEQHKMKKWQKTAGKKD